MINLENCKNVLMNFTATITKYGIVAKLFHWTIALILIFQIPFGFYLVDLDFSQERVDLEQYHALGGIIILYITILRLIWKLMTPSVLGNDAFPFQKLIAKLSHGSMYLAVFLITTSGALKKMYMGEDVNFIFFQTSFGLNNFGLSDLFYEIHIYANYFLIALIALHILAVIFHHVVLQDKILKKML